MKRAIAIRDRQEKANTNAPERKESPWKLKVKHGHFPHLKDAERFTIQEGKKRLLLGLDKIYSLPSFVTVHIYSWDCSFYISACERLHI